jgi:hypothetical protein
MNLFIKKHRGLWICLSVLVLIVAFKGPQWLAFERGVKAYLFAYPLITADVTRSVMTSPMAKGRVGAAPINQLAHARRFPDAHFTEVVAPNADTLYSIAWLDLSAGPMLLSTPDMKGRWVLLEILDAWSNAFASLGTRNYGGNEMTYALVGPDWHGTLPAGVTRIDSPTNLAWLIGRTYTAGAADFAAVNVVQDQYTLKPLSQLSETVITQEVTSNVPVDVKTPVVTQVATLSTAEYFGRLADLMTMNPPSSNDAAMMATLKSMGIVPGQKFDIEAMSPAQRQGTEDAVWFVKAFFETRSKGTQGTLDISQLQHSFFDGLSFVLNKCVLNVKNTWLIPLNIGVYGNNYPLRALITLVGYGANVPADAVYPMTSIDADGQKLDGANRYRLHFDQPHIPPVNAFWSITMYNDKGFFIDNPINRYAIGDRDQLKFNPDGSLDILIQSASPGADLDSNWLPAPPHNFKLIMRLYEPKPDVLNGNWVPPAIARIKTK